MDDDIFNAMVLKKWSESSEEVIQLKAELAEAREEVTLIRRENDALKAQLEIAQQNQVRSMSIIVRPTLNSSPPVVPGAPVQDKKTLSANSSIASAAKTPSSRSEEIKASANKKTIVTPESTHHKEVVNNSAIPRLRQLTLANFPLVIPDIGPKCFFSRGLISSTIGGNIQPLIVKVTKSQTPLAKERGITSYLCPGLDHNPWCPSAPGEHGFMFVGLGQEKNTFAQPEVHNVFVGTKGIGETTQKYTYLGIYVVSRVDPLTVEEWNTLSSDVKKTYATTTGKKTADNRSFEKIWSAYDAGQLSVPCVQLRCEGFDETLYAALLSAHEQILMSLPTSLGKHMRNVVDDNLEVPPRRMPRRSL